MIKGKKKLTLLLLGSMFFLNGILLTGLRAVPGNAIWVAPGGNDQNGTGSSVSPFKTIGFAITKIAAGDTLLLKGGDYMENVLLADKAEFVMMAADPADTARIVAPVTGPAIRYAPGAAPTGLSMVIKHLVITHVADVMGPGLQITEGQLTLEECRVRGNNLNTPGAGVQIRNTAIGLRPVLRGNHIYNNSAPSGAGIYNQSGSLELDGNKIHNNHATAGSGGGALLKQAYGVMISQNDFYSNDADSGAALAVFSLQAAQPTSNSLINNTLYFNNVKQNGGALYYEGAAVTLVLDGNVFAENQTQTDGGAFYLKATSTVILKKNNIMANQAGGFGGAGALVWIEAAVNIWNNNFTQNRADVDGGALYLDTVSSLSVGTASSLKNNFFHNRGANLLNNIHALNTIQSLALNNNYWGTTDQTSIINTLDIPGINDTWTTFENSPARVSQKLFHRQPYLWFADGRLDFGLSGIKPIGDSIFVVTTIPDTNFSLGGTVTTLPKIYTFDWSNLKNKGAGAQILLSLDDAERALLGNPAPSALQIYARTNGQWSKQPTQSNLDGSRLQTDSPGAPFTQYAVGKNASVVDSGFNIFPLPNQMDAALLPLIRVDFTQEMDASTMVAGAVQLYGGSSGAHTFQLNYDPLDRVLWIKPLFPFVAGEKVQMVLSDQILTASQNSLNGHSWSFQVGAFHGRGQFISGPVNVVSGQRRVVFNNWDGTGAPQMVRVSASLLEVLHADGAGGFQLEASQGLDANYSNLLLADLDKDGRNEIVLLNDTRVQAFKFLPDATFLSVMDTTFAAISTLNGVQIADFNLDGILDFALLRDYSDFREIQIFQGALRNGVFHMAGKPPVSLNGPGTSLGMMDIDLDGQPDLTVLQGAGSNDIALLYNNAGVFSPSFPTFGDISSPETLSNANIWQDGNFEGQREIIVTGLNVVSEPQLKVYNIDAGKKLVEQYGLALTAGVNGLQVADLNSDGFNDLLLVLDDGHIEIIYSDHGVLVTQQMINTQFIPLTVDAVDMDGDGDLDIFLTGDKQGNMQTQILKNADRSVRTWYVDGRAPANGDGSNALPLRRINEAIARSFNGDVIKIAAGGYSEFIDVSHSLVLEANGAEPVRLDVSGTVGFVNSLLQVRGVETFQLKNFTFGNPQLRPGLTAMDIHAVNDLKLDTIILHNFDTGLHIQKSVGSVNGLLAANGAEGLLVDSSDVAVSHMTIRDFSKHGVRIRASTAVFDSGRVYDNATQGISGSSGMVLEQKSDVTIMNHDIYNNGNSNIFLDDAALFIKLSRIADAKALNGVGGNGIVSGPNSQLSLTNTLVVGNPRAGVDSRDATVQVFYSVFAFNDSLAQNSGGGLMVQNAVNSSIGNSVFLKNSHGINASNSVLTIRYNDFYQNGANVSGSILGIGNLIRAPLFVYDSNPLGAKTLPDNLRAFKLAPGSPLLDAGNPLDKNGASGSRSDMGIFGSLGFPHGITAVPAVQISVIDTALQLDWQLPDMPDRSMLAGVAVFRGTHVDFYPDTSKLLNVIPGTPVSYRDNTVRFGQNYYYKLAFVDSNGASMAYSPLSLGRSDTYKLSVSINKVKVQLRVGDSLFYTIPLRNEGTFPFKARLKSGLPPWVKSVNESVEMQPGETVAFTLRFLATDIADDSLYRARALFSAVENHTLERPLDIEMLISPHDQLLPKTIISPLLPDTIEQSAFSIFFSADDTSRSTIGTELKDIRYVYTLQDKSGAVLKNGTTAARTLHFYNLLNGVYDFAVAAQDTAGNGAIGENSVGRRIALNLPPLRLSKNIWQLVTVPRDMARSEKKPDNKEIRAIKRWLQDGYFDINIDSLSPGNAYWVFNTQVINLDLGKFADVSADSSYRLPIVAGWNMIGSPWSWDIDWRRLRISLATDPNTVFAYSDAVKAQLISGDKTYYSSQRSQLGYDVEIDSRMRQGRGYWLYSKQNVTLIMDPRPLAPAQQGALEKNTDSPSALAMGKIVHLTLRDGPYIDKNNYFGVCDKLESYPYFYRNTPEPPQVFELPRLYAVQKGQKLTTNLRVRGEMDSLYTWNLLVENPGGNKSGSLLTWNPQAADNDVHYFLYHLESGEWFNMSEADSFRIKTNTVRNHFKLFATADVDFRPSILPVKYHLGQNYPNPFNPETRIQITIPFFADGVRSTLDVYDVLGRKIKNLINKPLKSGEINVRWDGRNTMGQKVASGIYFYRFHAGKYSVSKKMVLLR